ncbi:efflux transporter, RND family, MFP subunit [Caldalkalibacillus thermarum TA2.A1]|uniref:Efflux RND transporter periplasmic adaptor subunit n=1 Tax=Caldalkalibacillus thermarum (strain TA2.A1) TaxID=986075 RepID=F5L8N7_CALTT|nr:efflux RND transporter periplasmic adaptor subunit [Caldalkalibacillus thermarum]EGL82276.1 efflux transporter, RND family, MFP subunit [Caldalkalibacillus thermarum TA2.A1]QZT33430.1 efflux RND transporter periplasmic adaptor subunit [Caldalkalibacillus thermarum TA2.A1]
MRKWYLLLIFVILLLSGCNGTNVQTEEAEVYPVEFYTVSKQSVEQTISFTGTVMAREHLPIFPVVTGEVKKVHVQNGDQVEAGQLLVELEATEIHNSIEQAEAALQAAQAQLESAKAMRQQAIRQAELQLEQAQQAYQAVQSAEAPEIRLDEDNEQLREVLDPLVQMNQAQRERELQQAEMSVRAAQLALEQAQGTESVQAAEAAVQQAEVGLRIAQQQKKHTRLTAPIAGQVAELAVQEGQFVSPQLPLLSIVDLSRPYVHATVSEGQLQWIEVGQEVQIVLNALNSVTSGQISYISPLPAQQSRSYPVEISLAEAPDGVVPGMLARVTADLTSAEAQLMVPVDAVVYDQDRHVVFVITDGVARARPVTVGEELGEWLVIEDGLDEGEQIVVSGQYSLVDGAKVDIRKERHVDEIN